MQEEGARWGFEHVGGWGLCFYEGGVLLEWGQLCWFSFEAHNAELPRRGTRMTRIRRISTDTKSARIRVICVIRVLSWAPHIYHSLNINPWRRYAPMQPLRIKIKAYRWWELPHHTKAPSGSPVFSIASAGHFAGIRAFRSPDAGGEGHGGIWSRWGLWFVFLWGGVWKRVYVKLWNLKKWAADKRRWTAD